MLSAVRRTTSSMVLRRSCEAVMSRKTSSSAPAASYRRAASTGSPASRSFRNRTPLTTRPSLTSRHGMIRLVSLGRGYCNAETSPGGTPGSLDPGFAEPLLVSGLERRVRLRGDVPAQVRTAGAEQLPLDRGRGGHQLVRHLLVIDGFEPPVRVPVVEDDPGLVRPVRPGAVVQGVLEE